ncbi:MAG: tetratricopeptide repeat protein [Parasphingorhabdus sp.]|uniref:tetratricopeptide repeat protein n=1 Tax=Parasphingorhabdus sp. TaxID=2709688 RepID=UPI00300214E0
MAESSDQPAIAAAIYAEALKEQPHNQSLSSKAYLKAVEAGNFELAIQVIRARELDGDIEQEMPLLLFADAFARKDYRAAETAALLLEAQPNLGFLAPLLNAWLATSSSESPLTHLALAKDDKTASYYHREQFILHSLALGHEKNVLRLIDALVDQNEAGMAPVRIIAARHFLAKNDEEQALRILARERSGPEAKMAGDIRAGNFKNLAQKITPKVGTAFLMQRLALELGTQRAYFLGLVCAQAAARIFPDSDYGTLVLGEAFDNTDNTNAARAQFLKISNDSAFAVQAIGMEAAVYVADKDFSGAQQRLGQVIAKNPYEPELQILSGQILQLSGDPKGAADAFERAIALAEKRDSPDALLASYWLSLGGAQEQAGLWPQGLQSLEKANKLLPNSASILNYLGYAQLERRENTVAAVEAIRKAYELRSSSPAITDSLGWAYYVTGDHDKAVSYLELALNGEPKDPTINEHLGDAYWAVGRKYEARYAWRSAQLFADAEDAQRLADKIDIGLSSDLVSP